MALREGEVYRCPDAGCGCEVTVTRSAAAGCSGQQSPTCCCPVARRLTQAPNYFAPKKAWTDAGAATAVGFEVE